MQKHTKHGMSYTRLYHIWDNIRARATRPNNTYFQNYGGRGVALCPEWMEFIPFRDWALANGIALPTALYCMQGMADALRNG